MKQSGRFFQRFGPMMVVFLVLAYQYNSLTSTDLVVHPTITSQYDDSTKPSENTTSTEVNIHTSSDTPTSPIEKDHLDERSDEDSSYTTREENANNVTDTLRVDSIQQEDEEDSISLSNTTITDNYSQGSHEEEDLAHPSDYQSLLEEQQPCHQKFLLLTTRRSGSTWTCSLLDQQIDMTCGGPYSIDEKQSEMLINYSMKKVKEKRSTTWEQYQHDLDEAYQRVCDNAPSTAIGFKLMYDQIPIQIADDPRFTQYLRDNNITIVHLVREAKVLSLASTHALLEESKHSGHMTHHTRDSETAHTLLQYQKMPWDSGLVEEVVKLEEEHIDWQNRVESLVDVRHLYLQYENLLTQLNDTLSQVVSFVVPGNDGRDINLNPTYLQLHSAKCSDRIENFDEFADQEKMRNSRTIAACKKIDESMLIDES